MRSNANFLSLEKNYLFSQIENKIQEYKFYNPTSRLISLGIGDVTEPLCDAVTQAMHDAIDEMHTKENFKGYGPSQGYDFLKEAIKEEYESLNVNLEISEIFVSDGSKSDVGNILDIFDKKIRVLIPDPVYPAYVDSNLIAGNLVSYMSATEKNDFLPMPDNSMEFDIVYLCSPNNPTGSVYTKSQLKKWVEYAHTKNALIFFDAAYKDFITDDNLPKSIYEIDNAKDVAIEFCSFSKSAGFTGIRCGYTIIPHNIKSKNTSANILWNRRQATKFNGVSYITQKGALAVFSQEGKKQIRKTINKYKENAKTLSSFFKNHSKKVFGGKNSPYVWVSCPEKMKSWEFFDYLLNQAAVVGTPGLGFGKNGEGYFRFTAFCDPQSLECAISRMSLLFQKGM